MKLPPKISVVIDNYNYGRYLPESIESCLQQTYLPHEIIVVDDGSTDESREVLASYSDNPLIKVILQENRGQETALQRGFDLVTGDWVLGLDSDDFYLPGCLEEIAQRTEEGVSWIYFKAMFVDEHRKMTGTVPPPWIKLLEGNLKKDWLLNQAMPTFPPQSFNCYSMEFIRSHPISPNSMVNLAKAMPPDNYQTVLAALHGRVAAIPKLLGCYRKHPAGDWTVRTRSLRGIQELLRASRDREVWLRDLIEKRTGVLLKGPIFYTLQVFHWETRYRSLLLNPESHPLPEDKMPGFLATILSILWKDRALSPQRKITKAIKWILMGLTPRYSEALIRLKPWRLVSWYRTPKNRFIPEIKRRFPAKELIALGALGYFSF